MVHRTRQIAVLVGLTLVLAGCPGGGQGEQPDQLVIAAVQGVESIGLKNLAPMYEEETGIALQIEELPYPQLFEKLVTTFEADDATYDLVMLDDPWMPKFGTEGWLQPLDANFGFERDDDRAGVIYDVGTWPPPRGAVPPSEREKEQQLLGITIVGNVEMFMFRSDLMDEPATWDDVFDSPESVAAVQFLVDDLRAVAQDSPDTTDAADRSRLMAIGEALQSTVWPGEVLPDVLGEGTTVADTVRFIPMPAGPSGQGFGMMGNWLLAIPTAAQNGQAAADFISWMTEEETQRTYAENEGIPSRTSVLNDEALNQPNPYFAALAASLEAGPNWRPRTDQWNAVETVIGTELNAALAGQQSAEEAAQAASEQIRTIMEEAGYYD